MNTPAHMPLTGNPVFTGQHFLQIQARQTDGAVNLQIIDRSFGNRPDFSKFISGPDRFIVLPQDHALHRQAAQWASGVCPVDGALQTKADQMSEDAQTIAAAAFSTDTTNLQGAAALTPQEGAEWTTLLHRDPASNDLHLLVLGGTQYATPVYGNSRFWSTPQMQLAHLTELGADAIRPFTKIGSEYDTKNNGLTQLWKDRKTMMSDLRTICNVGENDEFIIFDGQKNHLAEMMEQLSHNASFNQDADVRSLAQWIVWEASQQLDCPSSSIQDYYEAAGRGEWSGHTVPAMNIRSMTFDSIVQALFELQKRDAGAVIFEIAKSEIGYTHQRPAEYVTTALAAAMAAGWTGPVFIQGDHFQVAAKDYKANPEAALQAAKDLIHEAMTAGMYNIDLDTSTLVVLNDNLRDEDFRNSLSQDELMALITEEQRANFEVAAELTLYIRKLEKELGLNGITVSIGGEIGEIGRGNSTAEELVAYMDGYNAAIGDGVKGLSKISIQTGTSHGGVPLADGSVARVKIDFPILGELGQLAREKYGLGGVVQHGASTLPDEAFNQFVKQDTLEVHLATGFQNIILGDVNNGTFASPYLPQGLIDRMVAWIHYSCQDMRKEGMTDDQFLYKARKKAFEVFKQEFMSLPVDTKEFIMAGLSDKFGMLFDELNVAGSKASVKAHVNKVAVSHKFPESGATPDAIAALQEDDGNEFAD